MSSLQAPRAGDPTLADAAEAEASVLYELHGARVHAFCLGRLGDREEAADAVQDTFAKAWIALRDGCEVRQPLAWLLTIAGNVCASRYRARRARPIETPLRDDAEGPAFDQRPPELVGLPTALRALPEEQRRAFVLRELRGCSYEEIGLDLGVSYSSVAALLHRSRRSLAASLSGAGRRALVVVPFPAVLRAAFQSGAGMTVAATTAGVLLVVGPQLLPAPTHDVPSRPAPARSTPAPRFGFDTEAFRLLRLSGVLVGRSATVPNASRWASVPFPRAGLGGVAARSSGDGVTVADGTVTGSGPTASDTQLGPKQPHPGAASPSPQTGGEPATSIASPRSPASPPSLTEGSGWPAGSTSDGRLPATPGAKGGDGRPADPGAQGNGPPADPGAQGNGPPADPGAQGNGPPADPGAQGNGPPADPGAQGNGPPADPGAQGNGPPADPGAQGNGPPADPGAQGGGNPS